MNGLEEARVAPRRVEVRASAESGDLFGHHEMRLTWSSIIGTHTSLQCVRTQDASSFGHIAFAMDPAFSSIGLSQGLLVGKRQDRIRTPQPFCLTI